MAVSLRLLELFRHASNWKGWLCWLALHEPQTTSLVAQHSPILEFQQR